MMPASRALIVQFQHALMMLTRLPVGWMGQSDTPPSIAQTVWAYPLVGCLVGAGGAGALGFGTALSLPAEICALLAVTGMIFITGALHEDGLADVADGFGGGRDAAQKLSIMRDSRIGSYGALALVLGQGLRVMTIAALARLDLAIAILALIGAEAGARAGLAVMLRAMPSARAQGLGHSAAGVSLGAMILALTLGAAALLMCLGPALGAVVALAIAMAQAGLSWLALRQIGGQTGDVLGAGQQLGAITGLVAALVWLR